MDRSTSSKLTWGGVAARSAGVAESVPTSPFLPTVSHPPGASVSRLPRLTPASLRGELLVPHHPASRPGRWWCMGRVGPLVLALTRGGRLARLAREAASLRPYDTRQNTKDA